MKRTIPLLIASIAGFVMVVAYFIPLTETWGDKAATWFSILSAVALVLGGGNLLKVHLHTISRQRAGWGYSAVTVVAFLATVFVGLLKIGVPPSPDFPGHPWAGAFDAEESAITWTYDFIVAPITSTMYGMLAFYVSSAAFRAFRAKNLEATLLLVTAVIVLLGQTYAGVAVSQFLTGVLPASITNNTSWMRFDRLTVVIQDVFNTAGVRAITIGVALGISATALRVLLGMDRSYIGSD